MERITISHFYLIISLLILFSGCSGSSSGDDDSGPAAVEAVPENVFLTGANVVRSSLKTARSGGRNIRFISPVMACSGYADPDWGKRRE